jgi:hypothetical protein
VVPLPHEDRAFAVGRYLADRLLLAEVDHLDVAQGIEGPAFDPLGEHFSSVNGVATNSFSLSLP